MANIITRAGKGAPLSWNEADANFTNLNNDKVETSILANYSTTVETNASIVAALAVHIDDTIDAHVSSAISYLPAGTGAVATDVQRKLRESVSVKDFGAVGDGVTDDTVAIQAAFDYLVSVGGGTLLVPPGDYYCGTYSTSASIVTIDGLNDSDISAYGARFIVNTTAAATPSLFVFTNCNRVVMRGARFFDSGFNPASWLTHSRWGMGAVALAATSTQCRGFKMEDCHAENLTYLLVTDQRANKRKIADIAVVDCRVKNAYYGVDVIYAGSNVKVDNLICEDVRRGFISYGARNADVDIKLYTSSGFNGSNAFISLACEGEAYDDTAVGGVGVIGAEANVENVRVKLNVTGFEAHTSYVHFYHQQADSAGYIANVEADVIVNNLSAVGKPDGTGSTNLFLIDHELPNTTILGSTTRKCKQISLSGGVIGSITGVPLVIDSANTSDLNTIALSPNLTSLTNTLLVNNLATATNWLTPFERPLTTLVPVGATSAGVVTGLVSEGTYMVIGKRVFFNAFMSWTNHTGTGQLRISGMPLAPNKVSPSIDNPSVLIEGNLNHTANSTLFAIIGGAADKQLLLYENTGTAVNIVSVDPTVAGIYISGSYLSA